jgi:TRAP-type C4-dicarboxylate transport system substrate-binding protein
MSFPHRSPAWLALLALAAAPAAGAGLAVKVGSVAPEGSPWHEVLLEMGAQWRQQSGGAITLRIFPGGVQGDEPEMVRKMRIGQLHCAAVTSTGLETIAPELGALSIPLLFHDYDELDYVRQRIAPRLQRALEDKGFILLTWGEGGWVRFFTTKPAVTIDQVRPMKLFTWAGKAETEELYTAAGFRPVPLALTDILPGLQTGVIEAFPAPPTAALAFQWFGLAKNMIDLKFAPIVGATIMTKAAWDRIDPALQPILLQEAQAAGDKLKAKIRGLEDQAIAAMQKRGLKVMQVPPEAEREWRRSAEQFYSRIRGELIQPRDFDEVVGLVQEYRRSRGVDQAARGR